MVVRDGDVYAALRDSSTALRGVIVTVCDGF